MVTLEIKKEKQINRFNLVNKGEAFRFNHDMYLKLNEELAYNIDREQGGGVEARS